MTSKISSFANFRSMNIHHFSFAITTTTSVIRIVKSLKAESNLFSSHWKVTEGNLSHYSNYVLTFLVHLVITKIISIDFFKSSANESRAEFLKGLFNSFEQKLSLTKGL